MKEIHLSKKDFKIGWFSGTGSGGQYRNRHMNCCRIKHVETGLSATGQSNRERPANQVEAFDKLARLIIAYYQDDAPERRTHADTIRNYHAVRNEVKDIASGEVRKYTDVMNKNAFGELINARRKSFS